MCGRMTIATSQEVLEARFHARVVEGIATHYNAYPNHDAYKLPVITTENSDHITMRYWGILPVWWKRDDRGLINIKYETLRDKKTFRKDLEERRCLIIADGFYEWKGERGHKTSYRIHLKGGEPFAFAGIYENNEREGNLLENFAIITTEPNELMREIHNRMPVILNRSDEEKWINPDTSHDQALEIMEYHYPVDEMEAYEVSKKVNVPGYESKELIMAIS